MVLMDKKQIGQWGENRAAEFLQEKGYEIIARNQRTPYGELDLVVRSADEIIFVEVKTRTSRRYGYPEEAVTPRKREHLLNAIACFLQEHPEWEQPWRVDVIAIEGNPDESSPRITWFENAIRA